jgi:hypothetical protein
MGMGAGGDLLPTPVLKSGFEIFGFFFNTGLSLFSVYLMNFYNTGAHKVSL